MKTLRLLPAIAASAALLVAASPADAAGVPATNLLRSINHARASHGLPRVHFAYGLTVAARAHSRDMLRRQYFGHTSPTGRTLFERITSSPFRTSGRWYAGETLAWAYGDRRRARAIVRMWLQSPAHRAILLSGRYRYIGLGKADGRFLGHRDARVWTADWGTR